MARVNKTKDQIAHEMKATAAAAKKRKFVTEKFFPVLQDCTIHQAKQLCKLIQNDIMSTFNQGMSNLVSTLNISEKFAKDEDLASKKYKEVAGIFDDMSIADALEIIGGMPQAIEGSMLVEDKSRHMTEIEWNENGSMMIKKPETLAVLCEKSHCADLRRLQMTGDWVAYSNKLGSDDSALTARGADPYEAVSNLVKIVCE